MNFADRPRKRPFHRIPAGFAGGGGKSRAKQVGPAKSSALSSVWRDGKGDVQVLASSTVALQHPVGTRERRVRRLGWYARAAGAVSAPAPRIGHRYTTT